MRLNYENGPAGPWLKVRRMFAQMYGMANDKLCMVKAISISHDFVRTTHAGRFPHWKTLPVSPPGCLPPMIIPPFFVGQLVHSYSRWTPQI